MGSVIKKTGLKASEYGKFAFSAYYGCSNMCKYCYLKHGRFARVLGIDFARLRKDLKSEDHAIKQLVKDIKARREELIKNGVFFAFNTDPLLPRTIGLTIKAVDILNSVKIPVKILSKRVDTLKLIFDSANVFGWDKSIIEIGQTITGCDRLEPVASKNRERIRGLGLIKDNGFKTFASFEPVIEPNTSFSFIVESIDVVDMYLVGVLKGKKYRPGEIKAFAERSIEIFNKNKKDYYFKESLRKQAGIKKQHYAV